MVASRDDFARFGCNADLSGNSEERGQKRLSAKNLGAIARQRPNEVGPRYWRLAYGITTILLICLIDNICNASLRCVIVLLESSHRSAFGLISQFAYTASALLRRMRLMQTTPSGVNRVGSTIHFGLIFWSEQC